jgi:hypothetical protein
MPMTWDERWVELASYVNEIEEVLLAMIALGFRTLSRLPKTDFLTLAFSTIASTTKSTSLSLNADISEA